MQEAGPSQDVNVASSPQAVKDALQTAAAEDPPAFSMDTSCVDDRGQRSLRLLRSGTSVWNRSVQIVVPPDARREYLAILKRADYATMAKSYGGPKKGALRIRCEVSVDFGEVQKISVQLADGEQSPRILGLARAILDYTESLGLKPEPAASLSDALKKWVAGQLNADTLNLRILQLPKTKGRDGLIVEVRNGEMLRRRYAPGRGVSNATYVPVDKPALLPVMNALIDADFEGLPANLMSNEPVEIEVSLLGHKKKVIARSFGRALPAESADAQGRFDRLLTTLQAFTAE